MLLWEILEAEETLYKNWTGYTSNILKKVITSKNQGNVIPGGWRVTRALRWVWEIEFSEEGRWVYQRVTCNWFFHSSFVKIFFCTREEKLPCSLLFNFHKWHKKGDSWLHIWKARGSVREKYEADKYTFILHFCSCYSLTLLLSDLSLTS